MSANAATNVIATLPELAWAAKEIGGKSVEAKSFLSGSEDPHYVDASPAFVFKAADASVLIYNGLQLESGWLPKVMQMSGNAKIQWNAAGNCDASAKIEKLEVIEDYDRSKGDIHPTGNPHYTMSPKSMIKAGEKIKECLEAAGAGDLAKNFESYKQKMEKLQNEGAKKLAVLKGKKLMVYHREFSYFLRDYGMKSEGSLEEVPGVLPSAAYLSRTAASAKKLGVDLVLASSVSPKSYLEKFKELSGIDYVMIQMHPQGEQDYAEFYEKALDKITSHAK